MVHRKSPNWRPSGVDIRHFETKSREGFGAFRPTSSLTSELAGTAPSANLGCLGRLVPIGWPPTCTRVHPAGQDLSPVLTSHFLLKLWLGRKTAPSLNVTSETNVHLRSQLSSEEVLPQRLSPTKYLSIPKRIILRIFGFMSPGRMPSMCASACHRRAKLPRRRRCLQSSSSWFVESLASDSSDS